MTEKKPTLLLVDDSVTNIDILIELLGQYYDLLVALDGQGALDILRSDKVDLVLLDIVMPEMDGYELCLKLKEDPETESIPVIFLTAKSDEASIERAYEVGGIDYVTKPFKRTELLARIKTHLKLRSLLREMEFLARHDPLTGLFNRRQFFHVASPLFDSSEMVFGAMIDIDNFKSINDNFGHSAGDTVINLVGKIILKHIAENQVAGRLGGEEFAIVGQGVSFDHFWEMIERIRCEVASQRLDRQQGLLEFRISCGIAEKSPAMRSIDHLLVKADRALYSAKREGKDRIVRLR